MSTSCTYKREEITAAAEGPNDARLPLRLPAELLEIVTRHAEARGESLSAFLRRSMVEMVIIDGIRDEAARVRGIDTTVLFPYTPGRDQEGEATNGTKDTKEDL